MTNKANSSVGIFRRFSAVGARNDNFRNDANGLARVVLRRGEYVVQIGRSPLSQAFDQLDDAQRLAGDFTAQQQRRT